MLTARTGDTGRTLIGLTPVRFVVVVVGTIVASSASVGLERAYSDRPPRSRKALFAGTTVVGISAGLTGMSVVDGTLGAGFVVPAGSVCFSGASGSEDGSPVDSSAVAGRGGAWLGTRELSPIRPVIGNRIDVVAGCGLPLGCIQDTGVPSSRRGIRRQRDRDRAALLRGHPIRLISDCVQPMVGGDPQPDEIVPL